MTTPNPKKAPVVRYRQTAWTVRGEPHGKSPTSRLPGMGENAAWSLGTRPPRARSPGLRTDATSWGGEKAGRLLGVESSVPPLTLLEGEPHGRTHRRARSADQLNEGRNRIPDGAEHGVHCCRPRVASDAARSWEHPQSAARSRRPTRQNQQGRAKVTLSILMNALPR
jgi:hypothetical protein